jgi:hypothetical protein
MEVSAAKGKGGGPNTVYNVSECKNAKRRRRKSSRPTIWNQYHENVCYLK